MLPIVRDAFSLRSFPPRSPLTKLILPSFLSAANFYGTSQINGAFFAVRNTWTARLFVSQWLSYATDIRAITDLDNQLGVSNLPEFVEHRHDQSILSLLSKKWGIPEYPATPAEMLDHNRDRT